MVLACRYADDVIIGTPYHISKDFIKSLNIKKVVYANSNEDGILEEMKAIDAYAIPKEMGIYEEF